MKVNKLPHNTQIKIDPTLLFFREPFSTMFKYDEKRMLLISENIKKNGYDPAYAIKVMMADNKLYVVEGHHRTLASKEAKIKPVIIIVDYKDVYEAYLDAREKQGLARKLNNSEIFQHVLNSLHTSNYSKNSRKSPNGDNRNSIKNEIATGLNIGLRTVERCYKIIDNGTGDEKQKVLSGKKTINSTYNEIIKSEKPKNEIKKVEIITIWKDDKLYIGKKRILSINPSFRYGNQKQFIKMKEQIEKIVSEVLQ